MDNKSLKKSQKVPYLGEKVPKYYCACCDYKCFHKSHYNKHLLTKKHQKKVSKSLNLVSKSAELKPNKTKKTYCCEFCGDQFSSRATYYRHKKKCKDKNNPDLENQKLKEELKAMKEEMKNLKNMQQHVTNNIQNNVTQNIIIIDQNTFLTKLANNALNIEDFVKQLKLDQNDYNFALENGYQKGVANVLIKKLENLDDTQRPIHSTDKKRGKFLVKTKGEWKKDNGESVDQVITTVGNKLNTYDIGHITAEDFNDPEVMELYQKQTLKLATKSDPKEKVKENKKIKNQLADSISIKEALENANKKIEN